MKIICTASPFAVVVVDANVFGRDVLNVMLPPSFVHVVVVEV